MFNVVWFKKDLRTRDHAPLTQAVLEKPTLGIFIIEPEWLASPEFDSSHYVFLRESLLDLERDLRALGVPLLARLGETVRTLDALNEEFGIHTLYRSETKPS
jgi:deoxyribodipyrimidine photo-lyase